MIRDIVNGTIQVTEGMFEGLGIDMKTLLASFMGGKLAQSPPNLIQNTVSSTENVDYKGDHI